MRSQSTGSLRRGAFLFVVTLTAVCIQLAGVGSLLPPLAKFNAPAAAQTGVAEPNDAAKAPDLAPTAAFTAGNIAAVVAASASANNTTASVIELLPSTTQTTPVQTIAIDGTGTNAIRVSGSATSTLYASRSNDGSIFTFTGHNNTNTSSNANTLNPRAVVAVTAAGTYSLATTYTGGSGNQTRAATTLDNSTWYIADQGGIYTNGSTSASPTANVRNARSFGGTVYVGQQSSTAGNIQVSTVSAPSGGSITGLTGLSNNASFQDFYLIRSGANGSTFDVLYVLSSTSATAGTVAKFSLVAGTWVSNGTYATTFGGFGLAAAQSGSGAALYVSTGNGATAANRIDRLVDAAGYNSTINVTSTLTIYTAPTGTTIKGLDFAPVAAQADLTIGVSGPATGVVGTPYDYTITASNVGSANATGVKATFALPSGVTYGSASGTGGFSCSQSGGIVTCTGASIVAAGSATITVSVTPTSVGSVVVPVGAAVVDPTIPSPRATKRTTVRRHRSLLW